jgi:hypothetical protein
MKVEQRFQRGVGLALLQGSLGSREHDTLGGTAYLQSFRQQARRKEEQQERRLWSASVNVGIEFLHSLCRRPADLTFQILLAILSSGLMCKLGRLSPSCCSIDGCCW